MCYKKDQKQKENNKTKYTPKKATHEADILHLCASLPAASNMLHNWRNIFDNLGYVGGPIQVTFSF